MKHFINTLLHFNLQFVAGERNTYDKLCLEAYEPFLDLLLDCPKWHADIEISGFMLEYIEDNLPWMNKKLKTLNDRNQVDVICVHYSESFWVAHTLEDFRRTWQFDKEIMDKIGLKFSPTFFAQENCFGQGLASVMQEFGIKNAVIPEKNYDWLYGHLTPLYPVYDMNGLNILFRGDEWQPREGQYFLFTADGPDKAVAYMWSKCGDGEPFVADDPYLNFRTNPRKVKEKKAFYEDAISKGYEFTTNDEFVQRVKAMGIETPKIPPITDGPWGLKTPGIFFWMGKYFSYYEQDVEILSLLTRARHCLTMADFLVNSAGLNMDSKLRTDFNYLIKRGFKFLATGQVSDATGWVPTMNEMYYGIDYALSAYYLGKRVLEQLTPRFGLQDAVIDTFHKKIIPKDGIKKAMQNDPLMRIALTGEKHEIDFEIKGDKKISQNGVALKEKHPVGEIKFDDLTPAMAAGDLPPFIKYKVIGSDSKVHWTKLTESAWRLDLSFMQNDINTGIKFEFSDPAHLKFSPSLMEDKVFELDYSKLQATYLYLPLPNGLINLDTDLWVIKHNDQGHIGVKADFEQKPKAIEFMIETNLMAVAGREQLDVEVEQNWVFTVFKGSKEDAIKIAQMINIRPIKPIRYPEFIYGNNELAPWVRFTRMVTK